MIRFYLVRAGQKFCVGKTIFMKVRNPFTNDAQIINCVNLETFCACHCDDSEMVELVNE